MSQTKTRLKCRHVVVAMLAACAPVVALAQIYKCPDAGGRMTIQQAPCTGGTKMEVKPASGPAAKPSPAAAGDKPMNEADRLNAMTEASMRERRLRSLQERLVPGARADIYTHRDACQRTQAALHVVRAARQQIRPERATAAQHQRRQAITQVVRALKVVLRAIQQPRRLALHVVDHLHASPPGKHAKASRE